MGEVERGRDEKNICPLCGKHIESFPDHMKSEHGVECEDDCENVARLMKLYEDADLKPLAKSFYQYDFEDFLRFLDDSDSIFSDLGYWDVVKTIDKLMDIVADKYRGEVISELPDIAREDPASWRSTIAFLTLLKTKDASIFPEIISIGSLEDYYELDTEIEEYIRSFGDKAFELMRKAMAKVPNFRYNLFFEIMANIDLERATDLFIGFFQNLPKDAYDEIRHRIFDFIGFLIEVYLEDEERKPGNLKVLVKKLVGILEYDDPNAEVDVDFYINVSKLWNIFRTWILTDIAYMKKQIPKQVLMIARRYKLDFLIRILDLVLIFPRGWKKFREIGYERYEAFISQIKYRSLNVYMLYYLGIINKSYGNIDVAERLFNKALSLAEGFDDPYLARNILFELIDLYFMSEKAQEMERTIKKISQLPREAIELHQYLIDRAKIYLDIIKGNLENAHEKLNLERVSEVGSAQDAFLACYILDKLGLKEKAKELFERFLSDFSMYTPDELFELARVMYLVCRCYYDLAMEKITSDEKLLAYVMDILESFDDPHLDSFLRFLAENVEDNPTLSFYLGVEAMREREYGKALSNFIKALRSQILDKNKVYVNIIVSAALTGRVSIIKRVGRLIKVEEGKIMTYFAKAIYYVAIGDTAQAKKLAKKIRPYDNVIYREVLKMIKNLQPKPEHYIFYVVGTQKLPPESCPKELIAL